MLDVTAGQKATSDAASDRLAAVFVAYQDFVHWFIFNRLRTPDWHLAEDLTSEVFLQLVRDARSLVLGDRTAGLLRMVARHVVIDHYRRARHTREGATDFADEFQARRLPTATSAAVIAVDRLIAIHELQQLQAAPVLAVAA
jgi:DNA-directed RNA polymerase specialized sigma24 family protein